MAVLLKETSLAAAGTTVPGDPDRDAAALGDIDIGAGRRAQLAAREFEVRAAVVGRAALIRHAEQRHVGELGGQRVEEADVERVEVRGRVAVADGDVVFDGVALIDAEARVGRRGLRDDAASARGS